MRMDRYYTQKNQIWEELTKRLGSGWRHAAMADVPPALQQHVANWLFDFNLYSKADVLLTSQRPSWCVVDPESGSFTLSGPLGPGLNPTLMFNVQRPDGKVDSWGWFVGSSSLE